MSGVPLNIDWQQILLHLMNFVILFAILYFLLYKPVRNFMDKRKATYTEMDDQANQAKAEAEELKAQYEEKLANFDAEILEKKQEATLAAEQQAKGIRQKAKEDAQDIISRAKQQAKAEHDRILDETGNELKELAKDAAEKAIFQSTSDAYDSFLNMVEEKEDDR